MCYGKHKGILKQNTAEKPTAQLEVAKFTAPKYRETQHPLG